MEVLSSHDGVDFCEYSDGYIKITNVREFIKELERTRRRERQAEYRRTHREQCNAASRRHYEKKHNVKKN